MGHKVFAASACALLVCLGIARAQPASSASAWRAGVASVVITPDTPIWLSGYAQRTHPAEGKVQDLHAKALALDDGRGGRAVIVTTELLGLPPAMSARVTRRIGAQTRLAPERILLTSSHTHTGPVLREGLTGAYDLPEEQQRAIEKYSEWLETQIADVAVRAMASLAPARLHFGRAQATFGVNRRVAGPNGITFGVNREGPNDPDVPVLRIDGTDGRLRAVLFGYACHNTTLTGDFYKWSGDYAGYAQAAIERAHPGAAAMFVIGAGADINPEPRGTLEHAEQNGEALARTVEQTLAGAMRPVSGPLRTAMTEITLPLAVPPKEEFEKRREDKNVHRRRHAERMLDRITRNAVMAEIPFTAQAIRLGDIVLVGLTGEVVVDYALRLRKEVRLPPSPLRGYGGPRKPDATSSFDLWVIAYAHDVPGYIPSERILKEGGYEADFSMIYYDKAGPFAPGLEDRIVQAVRNTVERTNR